MKKIFLSLFLACLICSEAFAVSEDMNIYVRQDVFDAKIEALRTEIQLGFQMVNTKLEAIRSDVKNLSNHVYRLEERINNMDKHIDFFYLMLLSFGIMLVFPCSKVFLYYYRESRKPSITLDDVRKLIEENNAKVLMRPQV